MKCASWPRSRPAATKEIGGLVKDIQRTVADAVAAMKDGSVEVERGVEQANQAGKALAEILSAAKEVNHQVSEIASAADQMSGLSNELVTATDSVSAVVEENTAATEEMSAEFERSDHGDREYRQRERREQRLGGRSVGLGGRNERPGGRSDRLGPIPGGDGRGFAADRGPIQADRPGTEVRTSSCQTGSAGHSRSNPIQWA